MKLVFGGYGKKMAIAVTQLLNIIYEDELMLVVNKPAGLVCHPTRQGPESSLIGRLRLYLGEGAKPQLVNRLDRETSGIVIAAKTPHSAYSLRKLWEKRLSKKEYLAIVHGFLKKEKDIISAPLGKDLNSIVAIKDWVRPDGAEAITEYEAISWFERDGKQFTFVKVIPKTGKKHQIRIHFAYIGHPIVGDKIYGGDETIYINYYLKGKLTPEQEKFLILPFHALHAWKVEFTMKSKKYTFQAEPESFFKEFVGNEQYENLRNLFL